MAAALTHEGARTRLLPCSHVGTRENTVCRIVGCRLSLRFAERGQCLKLGRTQRRFTKKQREALAARDGGCMSPDCDRPPSWTEAHHIDEWKAHNGLTDIAAGILLCKRDHLRLHNQGWRIERRNSNQYWLIPPITIDPDQTAIRLHSKAGLKLGNPIKPPAQEPAQSSA